MRRALRSSSATPAVLFCRSINKLGKYPDIKHVLVRHEQAAAHAADGYARVSGRTGVCLATSGPGATNLVTGITTAYMDSIPIVVITGNVARDLIGRDGFQEADITGITLPITKHNYLLMRASPRSRRRSRRRSTSPRPAARVRSSSTSPRMSLSKRPNGTAIRKAFRCAATRSWMCRAKRKSPRPRTTINAARKPIIIAGHGVVQSEAQDELIEFAERSDMCPCSDHPARHLGDARRSRAVLRLPRHARSFLRQYGRRPRRCRDWHRHALRRPRHGPLQRLQPHRENRPHRHRPGRDRQEFQDARAGQRRCQGDAVPG